MADELKTVSACYDERAHSRLDALDARVDKIEVRIAGFAGIGAALGSAVPVVINLIAQLFAN